MKLTRYLERQSTIRLEKLREWLDAELARREQQALSDTISGMYVTEYEVPEDEQRDDKG